VDRSTQPVDTALGCNAADLVEAAAGPEREPDEPLEARMKRSQQQRFFGCCRSTMEL
jgi:hypothetical protein